MTGVVGLFQEADVGSEERRLWFRGEVRLRVGGETVRVVRWRAAPGEDVFRRWFVRWVRQVYHGARVLRTRREGEQVSTLVVGRIPAPLKRGPYATVEWDDAGRRWRRRLTEEGKAVAADYLARYPQPAVVLWRVFPKIAAAALTARNYDESQQAAREGVVTGVATYSPDRGAGLVTHVVRHIAVAVQRSVAPRVRTLRTVSVSALGHASGMDGWDLATAELAARAPAEPEAADPRRWRAAMEGLGRREQYILTASFVRGLPYTKIAVRLGLSRERVRQLCNHAVYRLKVRAARDPAWLARVRGVPCGK